MRDKANLTAIILAAGEGSRMGSVKQLLPWKNSTMIEHCISQVLESAVNNVIVVLGANIEKIIPKVFEIQNVDLVENIKWQAGMQGSIQSGLRACKESCDAVLVFLVDQPAVNSAYINDLIDTYKQGENSIIATSYNSSIGVPALFDKKHFGDLLDLPNDYGGAKKYILNNIDDTHAIKPNFKLFDIDTVADYRKYFASYGTSE